MFDAGSRDTGSHQIETKNLDSSSDDGSIPQELDDSMIPNSSAAIQTDLNLQQYPNSSVYPSHGRNDNDHLMNNKTSSINAGDTGHVQSINTLMMKKS